jgi:hypothetical protein
MAKNTEEQTDIRDVELAKLASNGKRAIVRVATAKQTTADAETESPETGERAKAREMRVMSANEWPIRDMMSAETLAKLAKKVNVSQTAAKNILAEISKGYADKLAAARAKAKASETPETPAK